MLLMCRILVLFAALSWVFSTHAQYSNLRSKIVPYSTDTIKLDTFSIFPNSVVVSCGNDILTKEAYSIETSGALFYMNVSCSDSIHIQYRVMPFDFSAILKVRDSSLIYRQANSNVNKFLLSSSLSLEDAFGGGEIEKKGSISRGISFGNNQNLAMNSTLNLELSGEISPNLKILASISDNNLPIQPDGNTNKLQEFDQVFIQLYNDRLKLVAGDFWLNKPTGYFLNYRKRAQGLTFNYQWHTDTTSGWKTQLSGALSKGKFARQIIQGIEGNQGPYRLKGNENEPFIVILSGTERVYVDGKLLKRGQSFDYVMDYNAAELVFTARKLITKDSRIVVEFQYADQNYARTLFQTSSAFTSDRLKYWINLYSEQDSKNQPLQQQLNNSQKFLLSNIGDSLNLAQINSIDSIGFQETQVMYKLIDSIGFDSVLVFSTNKDSALYRATFTFVGMGKGDYILSNTIAIGKVYKWVAPIGGIKQGDYEPSKLIVTPKRKSMISSGLAFSLNKALTIETEVAYSINDLNTFSGINSLDDAGYASKSKLSGLIPLGRQTKRWKLEPKAEVEVLSKQFSPIEQYRAVEFDRDWNTRNKGYTGMQLASTLGTNFLNTDFGNLNVEGQQFLIGSNYAGNRLATNGKWVQNGFFARWDGSYLSSRTNQKNTFIRHRSELSKNINRIKLGYIDDHELNRFANSSGLLQGNSYQFFDYQFYVANADSTGNLFKVYFRERYDRLADSLPQLSPSAKAQTIGGEIKLSELKNQSLNVIGNYRELHIINQKLLNLTPENALLGRIDYELRMLKGAITWNNFYEIGSGLELKREFIYIQVNDGQGIYTWIDYNADGIKDLNEFELAQYADQADYIRIFTPSNTYIKTYSNEFNQAFFWRPERILTKSTNFKKIIMCFSDQFRIRINRKTNLFNQLNSFNPFSTQIRDTNLMASANLLRNTLYFNRTSSIFVAEYTIQSGSNKTLLASGFDSKSNRFNELTVHWNFMQSIGLETTYQRGLKESQVDFTNGRNYSLAYQSMQPSIIYQPGSHFRLSVKGRVSTKVNKKQYGGEKASLYELGLSLKFNKATSSSLLAEFKCLRIWYNGVSNSALGYEMLEALNRGINYTWNVSYLYSVSKNLQLSIQYSGRKSENLSVIHSGGMEVRAFF